MVRVWKTKGNFEIVATEILDLDCKPTFKEDPYKLMFLSFDNAYMFLRTTAKKGVKVISLEDGNKVTEIPTIH